MTKFIKGEFESTGQRWADDPANTVADELLEVLSEELGTDGPAETFGHPDENVVGRLVDDDEGVHQHNHAEAVAHDSHDAEGLTAEESAMHMVDDEADLQVEDGLSPAAESELRNF